jgi:hypothetical protein
LCAFHFRGERTRFAPLLEELADAEEEVVEEAEEDWETDTAELKGEAVEFCSMISYGGEPDIYVAE